MSDSSSFIPPPAAAVSTTNPRRRHNIHQFHVDIDSGNNAPTSLVNFARNNNTRAPPTGADRQQTPSPFSTKNSRIVSDEEQRKKYAGRLSSNLPPQPLANPQPPPPPTSSSFANFSSLIANPATQLWNNAQNSIQAFADQYAQPLDFESPQSSFYHLEQEPQEDFVEASLPVVMPYRDRTSELRTVIKSTQLKFQPNGNLKTNDAREKLIRSSIQFNQLARRIGRDLSMTCAKMEKLTQMAKKKSLFQDHSGEMEELSQVLKQDITGLNKQIAHLQQIALERGIASHHENQGKEQHSKLVVVGLQSKLADVSKTFQNVLEICTENMKLKRNRREKFSQPACVPSNLPPTANAGHMGSILLHDDAVAGGSSSVAVDMDCLEQQRMQEQLSLIDGTQSYHHDRLSAMENIESSISELGTIFRQLASLVSEQGEMITRIDSNVEQSSLNVEAAHHELLKYFNQISKNRWLIIKVFGVLMAFFIFFVVFMT